MYRKVVFPLTLAFSLFWIAACGPAPVTEPVDTTPAPNSPVAQAKPATTDETANTESANTESAASDVGELETGEAVTDVQHLDWGADEENCLIPGLVISGQVTGTVPCEPVTIGDDVPGAEPVEAPTVESEERREEAAMPDEPAQPQAQDEQAARMTALAVDDLSTQLGIPASQIEVKEVRAVTWPDSSLGCPQPDMMYAQVLTEGLLIRLSADGEMYFYHSGGNQPPFLCEQTLQMAPQPKGDEFVPPPGFELDTPQSD